MLLGKVVGYHDDRVSLIEEALDRTSGEAEECRRAAAGEVVLGASRPGGCTA